MVHKEDGKVVAAFGMTHTPGLGNLMHLPPHDQVDRIVAGYDIVRKEIEEAKPDVIVAFVNDHVDMYTLYNMPAFSIAVGGKVDASSGGEMLTQRLPAHVPFLLIENPARALVIGLGRGVTASSARTQHPGSVTAVEIAPAVV